MKLTFEKLNREDAGEYANVWRVLGNDIVFVIFEMTKSSYEKSYEPPHRFTLTQEKQTGSRMKFKNMSEVIKEIHRICKIESGSQLYGE